MLPIPFALLILGVLGIVFALVAGEVQAAELKRWTHPRRFWVAMSGGLFVVVPSWYVAICYPDWYVSYVFSAGVLPRVACALIATGVSSALVIGFWLGATGLSARRVDLLALTLVALVVALLLVSGAFGARLGLVGSHVQFARSTLGIKLTESGLGRAVLWGSVVQLLAFAYLLRILGFAPKSGRDAR